MSTAVLARHTINATSALLKISGLRLVLPQNEILAIEAMSAVDGRDAATMSAGWLQHAQQRWPVYCLSPELSLETDVPVARRACVLLAAQTGYVGILCDDVSIEQSLERRHELPRAMCLAGTPVMGLIELEDGRIACVTDSQRLLSHIAGLVGA